MKMWILGALRARLFLEVFMKRVLMLIQQLIPFVVFHVFYKLSMQVSLICLLSKLIIHTLCARG